MSGASERVLARLASPGARLARLSGAEGFGVFPNTDRRRRPLARLDAAQVRALESAGAIARDGDDFVLSQAGRARLRRESAESGEAYLAQHGEIVDRAIASSRGVMIDARGLDVGAVMRRLAALRDLRGASWLSADELRAASHLRADWEASQAGLVRGSDWSAGPRSGSARGPGAAQEVALAARCDARRRMTDALAALAPPLRLVVERVCLHEHGLEALERSEGWPARSGKVALKLGLSQLAQRLR